MDIIIDQGAKLIPVEIKSGQTITPDYFSGLQKWLEIAGLPASHPAWVVYAGQSIQKRSIAKVIGWKQISKIDV